MPPTDTALTAPSIGRSLSDSHRTVTVPHGGPFWRRLFAFVGPGYLVAVGYMDPGNWATDIAGGSAFGLSHDLFQIGPLRPDNRHRRFRNLYFAGASTRPATGLPLVTLGAMQTAQRICEEIPA